MGGGAGWAPPSHTAPPHPLPSPEHCPSHRCTGQEAATSTTWHQAPPTASDPVRRQSLTHRTGPLLRCGPVVLYSQTTRQVMRRRCVVLSPFGSFSPRAGSGTSPFSVLSFSPQGRADTRDRGVRLRALRAVGPPPPPRPRPPRPPAHWLGRPHRCPGPRPPQSSLPSDQDRDTPPWVPQNFFASFFWGKYIWTPIFWSPATPPPGLKEKPGRDLWPPTSPGRCVARPSLLFGQRRLHPREYPFPIDAGFRFRVRSHSPSVEWGPPWTNPADRCHGGGGPDRGLPG